MKFELSFFETLILQDLAETQRYSADEAKQFSNDIRNELQRIKKSIRSQALSLPESRVHFLIQHHQAATIMLSDTLTVFRQKNGMLHATDWDVHLTEDVPATASAALLDLLLFLNNTFPAHTDNDQKVPLLQAMRLSEEIHAEVGALRAMAAERNLSPNLLTDILSHTETFTRHAGNVPVTYRTLRYIRTFNEAMLKTLLRATPSQADDFILDLALYLNCNTHGILRYFIDTITRDVDQCADSHEKILTLKRWQKRIRQTVEKPGSAFNSAMPSLREQVLQWLDEEHVFLHDQLALHSMAPAHSRQEVKMNTPLSVDQLAAFIRTLVDSGVITNKNKREVIAFFARHFTTVQRSTISAENLRTCFYRIESGTYNAIRNLVTKMLDFLPGKKVYEIRKQPARQ